MFNNKQESRFYNGNPNVKIAGAQQSYTLDQVKKIQKYTTSPCAFINDCVKVISIDKGIIPFHLYPYQERIINAVHNNRFTICKLFRQSGKALPLDTPLATPNGFKPIKDIHPGDIVYGDDGKETLVTAESPIQSLQMYRITFDTGEQIVACKDHQWSVRDRRNSKRNCERVLTTEQIANTNWRNKNKRGYWEYRFYIPNTHPVEYPKRELDIDPYLLGVWLGDGNSRDNRFTFEECNLEFFRQQGITPIITKGQTRIGSKGQNIYTARIQQLSFDNLKKYDLLQNKHIPIDYLLASIDQRVALLQGLMDTDGYIGKKHDCEIAFSIKYKQLCDDVEQLLHSLGIKVFKKYKQSTSSYSLYFYADGTKFDCCRLPYKKANINYNTTSQTRYVNSRTIVDVEKLEDLQLAKCIQVDNARHVYLCGKNYLPTHNSTVIAAYCLWFGIFNDNKDIVILANKLAAAKELFSRIEMMYETLPDYVKPGVKEYNKTSMVLENGSKISCAATSASAIRGRSIGLLICDEFAFLPPGIAEEFITSSFPALSASGTSKLVLISTPYGLNHFYKIWHDSEQGLNDFVHVEGKWQEIHADDDWFETQSKLLGDPVKVAQELECVTGNTKIRIKNKKTGLIEELSIKQLYDRISADTSG